MSDTQRLWGKQRKWTPAEVATRERLYALMTSAGGHVMKQSSLADLMGLSYDEVERYLNWLKGRQECRRVKDGGWQATAPVLATADTSPFPKPWWRTPDVGLWGDDHGW